jgi:transposase
VYLGPEITPRRRASIVTLAFLRVPFRQIEQMTGVSKSTAHNIVRNAVTNAADKRLAAISSAGDLEGEERASGAGASGAGASGADGLLASMQRLDIGGSAEPQYAELSLQELIAAEVLDPKKRIGRPETLTEAEKDHLVATVKRDFKTRRMRLVDIHREAGLTHVSDTTVFRALHERKIKAYREEFKFILSSDNKQIRLVYCKEREHWETNKEWANCGFTDEMAIEVGGTFGVCLVWRDQSEQWHDDCVGAKKKQGPSVMCWGFIMWNYKGPFYVWDPETKEEREAAAIEIPKLNAEYAEEEKRLNAGWKATEEWKALRERELEEAREIRAAAKAKGEKASKTTQTWHNKKHKIAKVKHGKGKGIDSWRYVQNVCRPVLWPECKRLAAENPNFILMEAGAAAHGSGYTTQERVREGVRKMDWPPNSPDFNPIERIWTLMKRRIQTRRGAERITTVNEMKKVLQEEWDKITIEEINTEIAKLPTIMKRCIAVNGGNKYHA